MLKARFRCVGSNSREEQVGPSGKQKPVGLTNLKLTSVADENGKQLWPQNPNFVLDINNLSQEFAHEFVVGQELEITITPVVASVPQSAENP